MNIISISEGSKDFGIKELFRDLNIHVKFDDTHTLKKFEAESEKIFNDLRNSFIFKENKFAGVYAYTYEKEAITTEIKISGPAMISKN